MYASPIKDSQIERKKEEGSKIDRFFGGKRGLGVPVFRGVACLKRVGESFAEMEGRE